MIEIFTHMWQSSAIMCATHLPSLPLRTYVQLEKLTSFSSSTLGVSPDPDTNSSYVSDKGECGTGGGYACGMWVRACLQYLVEFGGLVQLQPQDVLVYFHFSWLHLQEEDLK